jgi:hypothetical protein
MDFLNILQSQGLPDEILKKTIATANTKTLALAVQDDDRNANLVSNALLDREFLRDRLNTYGLVYKVRAMLDKPAGLLTTIENFASRYQITLDTLTLSMILRIVMLLQIYNGGGKTQTTDQGYTLIATPSTSTGPTGLVEAALNIQTATSAEHLALARAVIILNALFDFRYDSNPEFNYLSHRLVNMVAMRFTVTFEVWRSLLHGQDRDGITRLAYLMAYAIEVEFTIGVNMTQELITSLFDQLYQLAPGVHRDYLLKFVAGQPWQSIGEIPPIVDLAYSQALKHQVYEALAIIHHHYGGRYAFRPFDEPGSWTNLLNANIMNTSEAHNSVHYILAGRTLSEFKDSFPQPLIDFNLTSFFDHSMITAVAEQWVTSDSAQREQLLMNVMAKNRSTASTETRDVITWWVNHGVNPLELAQLIVKNGSQPQLLGQGIVFKRWLKQLLYYPEVKPYLQEPEYWEYISIPNRHDYNDDITVLSLHYSGIHLSQRPDIRDIMTQAFYVRPDILAYFD